MVYEVSGFSASRLLTRNLLLPSAGICVFLSLCFASAGGFPVLKGFIQAGIRIT